MADTNEEEVARAKARGSSAGDWETKRNIDRYKRIVKDPAKIPADSGFEEALKEYGVLQTISRLYPQIQSQLGFKRALQKLVPNLGLGLQSRVTSPAMDTVDTGLQNFAIHKTKAEQGRPSDFDVRMQQQIIPNTSDSPDIFQSRLQNYQKKAAGEITDMKYRLQASGVPRSEIRGTHTNPYLWDIEKMAGKFGRINDAKLQSAEPPDLTPAQEYESKPGLARILELAKNPDFMKGMSRDNPLDFQEKVVDSYISGSGTEEQRLQGPALKEHIAELRDWAQWSKEQLARKKPDAGK